jgi:hypothetical protein
MGFAYLSHVCKAKPIQYEDKFVCHPAPERTLTEVEEFHMPGKFFSEHARQAFEKKIQEEKVRRGNIKTCLPWYCRRSQHQHQRQLHQRHQHCCLPLQPQPSHHHCHRCHSLHHPYLHIRPNCSDAFRACTHASVCLSVCAHPTQHCYATTLSSHCRGIAVSLCACCLDAGATVA